MAPTSPLQTCTCCGGTGFIQKGVFSQAQVDEWGLSAQETESIHRQEGITCRRCGCNLRSMALALAICRCYKYEGTLAKFIEERSSRRLRVLEVFQAGTLTPFLSQLPRYAIALQDEVDIRLLPYHNCSFDLVVHEPRLQHPVQALPQLGECHRVLSPGGYFVLATPVMTDGMTLTQLEVASTYHTEPKHERELGADTWKDVIHAGFRECRLITPEFPSALAFVGVRWAEESDIRDDFPNFLNPLNE